MGRTPTPTAAGVIVKGPALPVVQKFHANGTHWMWKQNGEGSIGPVSSGGQWEKHKKNAGAKFCETNLQKDDQLF